MFRLSVLSAIADVAGPFWSGSVAPLSPSPRYERQFPMIRQLAIGLALFLAPFAVYQLFLWAARPFPGQDKPQGWTPLAVGWLMITAMLLVIAGFAVWAGTSGAPPDATYVPAHMENGQFVPGTFKYK
jgi:hypothetical protein